MLLVSSLRILCLALDCEDCLLFFLKVLYFTFKSVIQFELIFYIKCEVEVELIFFVCGCQLLQHCSLKRLSSLNCSCTFVKNLVSILVWLSFWILSSGHTLIFASVLPLIPHSFDYCCYIISLEIGWTDSSHYSF